MNREELAKSMYDTYCISVGGKAFNGDELPKSDEFFNDPAKVKQADAWRSVADIVLKYQQKPFIELGLKAKDKITGFQGIIIGRAEYLTGCTQYGVCPKAKEGEKTLGTEWFDEGRIEITGDGVTVKDVAADQNGGPNRDSPQ